MPLTGNIPNEMILASAGSGKTWQLTNRYIALLGLQLKSNIPVTPERIVAVTFTRKAAGEFFDSILVKLAEAAANPKKAASLAADSNDPFAPVLQSLDSDDYRKLLRIFINRMPRLFLGTLDSLFSNILRAFPAEFGLTADFEVMDDYQSALAQAQVYRSVFERQAGESKDPSKAQKDFLESFRRATFGKEESRIVRYLDTFVEDLHDLYLSASSGEKWGNPKAVWKDGSGGWIASGIDVKEEFEKLFASFEANPDPKQINWKYWEEFRDAMAEHQPGSPIKGRVEYMLKAFLANWKDILAGHAEIKFNRKVHSFNPDECTSIRRLVQYIVGSELVVKLQRTHGIWELLHLYESTYANEIRRQGQLTFQDLQLLLAGLDKEETATAAILSQIPGDDDRLRIDYRLDARYDHWLLDEFQDTNITQWKVIANLIDEVVQDTSGTRSLFQVGDVKQAIYAWRGGDTRLFREIENRYNINAERISLRNLDVSWRSGFDVIDPVNRVFGNREKLEKLGLPEQTIDQWEWNDHAVAPPNQDDAGITCLLNPIPPDGEKLEKEDSFALVVGILEEIQPVERGISCAILVQTNRNGTELVDYIRAHSSIPVVSESDVLIASDNPLSRAIVSYFRCAAHPGDTFSWEHLHMSPFRKVIERDNLTAGSLSSQTIKLLFDSDFESVTRSFIEQISSAFGQPLDEFTEERAEEFALAARLFDEKGSRDIDDFLAYIERHTTREPVASSAVQVMTIHKSKGLTFDAVILPDLKGNSLTTARSEIGAKEDKDRSIEWVLDLPIRPIVEADPILSEHLASKEAEAAYEALCKFYVALTRARYANYLITDPVPKTSRSQNFVKLLELVLAEGFEEEVTTFHETEASLRYQSDTPRTDRNWFKGFERKSAPEEEPPLALPQFEADRFRPRRRTPSSSEEYTVPAAQIFHPSGSNAREFGTLVHSMFEELEWYSSNSMETLARNWRDQTITNTEQIETALAEVANCFEETEVQRLMSRPDGNSELWREKSFEILIGNEWLSGTFDRVVIEKSHDGIPEKARIIDFKTDRISESKEMESACEKYRSQLETYREVLKKMLLLPDESIELTLIFTHPAKVAKL